MKYKTDERKAAEQEYTITAFDYLRDPVGSRDWELFWKGWQARSILAAAPVSQQELSEDEIASIFNRHGHHLFEEPDVRCYDPAEMQSVARAILAAKEKR